MPSNKSLSKLERKAIEVVSDLRVDPQPNQVVSFDREQAFQLYATFCGDVERTAHALNITPVQVLSVADDEKWAERLKAIIELKKSDRPGDVERGINRALNFVQAHRLRIFLERTLTMLYAKTDEEILKYCSEAKFDKDGDHLGTKLVTRSLADLASAVEKCHALTYAALNDTAPERARRTQETGSGSAGELHVAIAEALSRVRGSNTPRAQLFDAQLEAAQTQVADNIVSKQI